jgi:hypothetical protein
MKCDLNRTGEETVKAHFKTLNSAHFWKNRSSVSMAGDPVVNDRM